MGRRDRERVTQQNFDTLRTIRIFAFDTSGEEWTDLKQRVKETVEAFKGYEVEETEAEG